MHHSIIVGFLHVPIREWWLRQWENSTSFILVLVLIGLTWILFSRFIKNGRNLLPPGPMGLPILGSLPFISGDFHSYVTDLARTYGPFISVRLGNKIIVVISTSSVAREVLKDQDIIFANRGVTTVSKFGFYGGSDILFNSYGPEWRMLRKICTQDMLSGPKVKSFYNIRQREARKTVKNLWIQRMSPVDVTEVMFMTILDTITDILWGSGENEVAKRSLGAEFRFFVEEMAMHLGKLNISDLFPCLAYFDFGGAKKQLKSLSKWYDDLLESIIDERMRTSDNNKEDMLQTLLNLRNEYKDSKMPLTTTHIKGLLLDMILGGTNATTSLMEFMLAEMMNEPHIMKKAQQELEVIVGSNNVVEESHIPKLPYLHAIMKETLRLHPGAPLLAPHCPSESCIVGGFTIPKDASVLVNVWTIHKDPSIWEDPLKFDPERFINSNRDYNGNDFNYFPFGSGRRICLGIEFAKKNSLFLVASLIHSFEWKMSGEEKVDVEEKIELGLRKKKPLVAIPIPRLFNEELYE